MDMFEEGDIVTNYAGEKLIDNLINRINRDIAFLTELLCDLRETHEKSKNQLTQRRLKKAIDDISEFLKKEIG